MTYIQQDNLQQRINIKLETLRWNQQSVKCLNPCVYAMTADIRLSLCIKTY